MGVIVKNSFQALCLRGGGVSMVASQLGPELCAAVSRTKPGCSSEQLQVFIPECELFYVEVYTNVLPPLIHV